MVKYQKEKWNREKRAEERMEKYFNPFSHDRNPFFIVFCDIAYIA